MSSRGLATARVLQFCRIMELTPRSIRLAGCLLLATVAACSAAVGESTGTSDDEAALRGAEVDGDNKFLYVGYTSGTSLCTASVLMDTTPSGCRTVLTAKHCSNAVGKITLIKYVGST